MKLLVFVKCFLTATMVGMTLASADGPAADPKGETIGKSVTVRMEQEPARFKLTVRKAPVASEPRQVDVPFWLKGPTRPILVVRYEHNGEVYFRITNFRRRIIPDAPGPGLFDADGNYICTASGGFSGRGDKRCPDWVYELGEGKVVYKWEQPKHDLNGGKGSPQTGNR